MRPKTSIPTNWCRLTGGDLAPFTAGSHIDLHLPNGMIRSYSLVNDQSERHRYVIAVNKDAASRGGSSFVHDTIRAGDIIDGLRSQEQLSRSTKMRSIPC